MWGRKEGGRGRKVRILIHTYDVHEIASLVYQKLWAKKIKNKSINILNYTREGGNTIYFLLEEALTLV